LDSFLPGLLSGAVGGFISGTFVEWWKSGREDLAKLCDEFCGQIAIAADASAEYWVMAGNDARCVITESRIYGLQQRISGYNAITCTRLHDAAADWVEDELQRFFDALTGGDFQNPGRAPDIGAAHKAQHRGAQAILAVRRGAYETASFKESAYRWLHFKR
jgi:hypothetical protein